eukprot:366576-Chlamydomonas_euryale.AAC.7
MLQMMVMKDEQCWQHSALIRAVRCVATHTTHNNNNRRCHYPPHWTVTAARGRRTFVFPRILPQPSALVSVTLPRPMGVVLEWDERRERAFVADLVDGSAAKQRSKVGCFACMPGGRRGGGVALNQST